MKTRSRPQSQTRGKLVTINAAIEEVHRDALVREANANDRSVSAELRRAIRFYIDEKLGAKAT